jgi:hypothetical protein
VTGADRTDVHALPPRITRLFFILNALIRPLAVQWVKELFDPVIPAAKDIEEVEDHIANDPSSDDGFDDMALDDESEAEAEAEAAEATMHALVKPSSIQVTYTFAAAGRKLTSKALSKLMGNFTQEFLGARFGLSAWRHICIALQRDYLGLIDDTNAVKGDSIFDSQAGHSATISLKYYAVQDDDRALVRADSMEKYIQASQCLHRWLDGEQLTHVPR